MSDAPGLVYAEKAEDYFGLARKEGVPLLPAGRADRMLAMPLTFQYVLRGVRV